MRAARSEDTISNEHAYTPNSFLLELEDLAAELPDIPITPFGFGSKSVLVLRNAQPLSADRTCPGRHLAESGILLFPETELIAFQMVPIEVRGAPLPHNCWWRSWTPPSCGIPYNPRIGS